MVFDAVFPAAQSLQIPSKYFAKYAFAKKPNVG